MMRNNNYYRNQNGWNTTSHDYHSHIAKMLRTPTMLPEVPHYPNVHRVFNNKSNYEEEQESPKEQTSGSQNQKKIQFADEKSEGDPNEESDSEEDIDTRADNYTQQRRRGFGLFQWKSFKVAR